jgi:uncharacterized membrane protein
LVLLGFALGGFIDGILLHQVLQWHHLLSAVDQGTIPLAVQITADGLFHLLMYALVVIGLWLVWRRREALAQGTSARTVLRLALLGFFLWQLVDVVVFHWLLQIHRVRMDTGSPLAWDLGWFAVFGLVPLLVAALLGAPRGPGGGTGTRAGVSLSVVALMAGVWAAMPPAGNEDVLVVFAPGTHPARAASALGLVDGRVTWVDAGGLVWSIRTEDRLAALRLYGHGAMLVSSSAMGLGCASWTRPQTRSVL